MTLEQQIVAFRRSLSANVGEYSNLAKLSDAEILEAMDILMGSYPEYAPTLLYREEIEALILAAPLAERLTSPYAFIRNYK